MMECQVKISIRSMWTIESVISGNSVGHVHVCSENKKVNQEVFANAVFSNIS